MPKSRILNFEFRISNCKWILPIVIFTVLLTLFSIRYPLQAQSPSPTSALQKAQDDYKFQLSKYSDLHDRYLTTRSNFLQFKTATAKNDAYLKTKDYLIQVDNIYISYLYLASENANAIDFDKAKRPKDKIIALLKNQTDFIKQNQQNISSATDLQGLVDNASQLKSEISTSLTPQMNFIFASMNVAESTAMYQDFINISSLLDQQVTNSQKSSILVNWSSEIADIKQKTGDIESTAQARLDSQNGNDFNQGYLSQTSNLIDQVGTQLARAKILFNEAVRLFF